MLEHTGRKTGIRRYVVLEAVDHEDERTYIVAAGFGDGAQWLRNVGASERVRVYVGSRRPMSAMARALTSEEAAAALTAYASRHARAWAALKPVFEATLGARIDGDGTSLPMIALDLARQSSQRDTLAGQAPPAAPMACPGPLRPHGPSPGSARPVNPPAGHPARPLHVTWPALSFPRPPSTA